VIASSIDVPRIVLSLHDNHHHAHRFPPSSLTLLPVRTFLPAYKPRLARFVTARVNAMRPSGMVFD
jgi:hypothetical protein